MILPKRRKPPKMNVREPSDRLCQGHIRWIRQHYCAVKGLNGHECKGKIEAHHVRLGTDGGIGLKPSDHWAVPLCGAAHRTLHDRGQISFETLWAVDLKEIAEGLAARSPALRKRDKVMADFLGLGGAA